MTMEMQSTPFKSYLKNKVHVLNLYLYVGVPLEDSFSGNGT